MSDRIESHWRQRWDTAQDNLDVAHGRILRLRVEVNEWRAAAYEAAVDGCAIGAVGKWCGHCEACSNNRSLIRLLGGTT